MIETTATTPAASRVSAPAAAARDVERDACAADVQRFLERFVRFGATPSVATYVPLFHPDATLFDDGMERPITVAEIPASITATLAIAQGFVMVPERWRVHERAVFVEARNQASIFGTPLSWRSVYRVDLAGDLVRRGRRYYDRAPLLEIVDPSGPRLPSLLGEAAVSAWPAAACTAPGIAPADLVAVCERGFRDGTWQELGALFREDAVLVAPTLPRPLARAEVAPHRRALTELIGGGHLRARAWAGDESLLLIEWEANVATPSGDHLLGMIDRFDLVCGRILAARTYFDAAAWARARTPRNA